MFPIHPFSTALKNKKTVRFSDVYSGVEKGYIENKKVNVTLKDDPVTIKTPERRPLQYNVQQNELVFFLTLNMYLSAGKLEELLLLPVSLLLILNKFHTKP